MDTWAKKFKKYPNIVVAKIDATKNGNNTVYSIR
jgi:hypothetical protein